MCPAVPAVGLLHPTGSIPMALSHPHIPSSPPQCCVLTPRYAFSTFCSQMLNFSSSTGFLALPQLQALHTADAPAPFSAASLQLLPCSSAPQGLLQVRGAPASCSSSWATFSSHPAPQDLPTPRPSTPRPSFSAQALQLSSRSTFLIQALSFQLQAFIPPQPCISAHAR